ncbi:hypothetical protein H7J93_13845 [Mycobacterium barrassiae]|uniref:hypothetical protein n=1 Tax=Mycobacterium barrassiae TaxID=319709 RepID=UPI002265B5A7|nr:hypothetical protein [Mycobacterium barrassiae]MCV7300712.1 hypothetical protein [Mycobacterium barrassiae]
MTDLLNGIPRVDPTAEPSWMLRAVGTILASYAVKTDGVRTINVFRLSPDGGV